MGTRGTPGARVMARGKTLSRFTSLTATASLALLLFAAGPADASDDLPQTAASAYVVADLVAPPLPAVNPLRGFRPSARAAAPTAAPPAPTTTSATAADTTAARRPVDDAWRPAQHSFSKSAPHFQPASPSRAVPVADALAPLLDRPVSQQDIDKLRESIDLTLKGDHAEAAAARRQIADPTASKLALWHQLRKNDRPTDALDLERFRAANSDWPGGPLMRKLGEQALLREDADPARVTGFYASAMPTSGLGRFLLAQAWQRSGRRDDAIRLAREAWQNDSFSAEAEAAFLAVFAGALRGEDHLRRADTLLFKDSRPLFAEVERLLPRLAGDAQRRVRLRLDVARHHNAAAEKEFARLGSDALLADPGLLLARIQLARRKKDFATAWRLLARAPQEAKRMGSPAAWWAERRLQARLALADGKAAAAYDIAARHGEIAGEALAEAEFLAGWIALSRLKDPDRAKRHLSASAAASKDDQDQARAAYWLGRARLAQKDDIGALSHFAEASRLKHQYYGQLALQRLDANGLTVEERPASPSADSVRQFLGRDAVRALFIAQQAQLDGVAPLFASHLAWRLTDPGEMTLLAELATQMRSRHGAVLAGKIGIHRGFPLDRYAYPTDALPEYDRLTAEVDKALLLALARQESEFNAAAHSPAGAHGMMQIMPGTAKLIAHKHGVAYSRERLTRDPSYNVALGVAHIHDLIQQYNGSYILTLVAYNAGPGRARQWVERFGDPRTREIDAIDWVENIPFDETRRYVQRILASAQLFRHRLRGGTGAIRLVQDLERGSPEPARKTAADTPFKAASASE